MRRLLLLVSLLAITHTLGAQFSGESTVLTAQLTATPSRPVIGGRVDLVATLTVAPELHINSQKPTQEYLIPTQLTFLPLPGIRFLDSSYPPAEMKAFAFSAGEKLSVYEGQVVIRGQAEITAEAATGRQTVRAVLSYQGCNDKSCFAPQTDTLQVELDVLPSQEAVVAEAKGGESIQADSAPMVSGDEARAAQILQKGLIYALAAFFLVGLALNLTPCVYPIIPITVSYFSGRKETSRASGLASALFYLLGIAVSFALLGLISSLAGRQWGFMFSSPWFVVVISSIILLMAASMFGAFEITVPTFLLNKFGSSREGVIGSLVMGLTVGVIIAPCAAGIIIGLVTLVARMGLVVKGGLLFFAMGLGLGLPYLVLAMFSGLLNRLPQSGEWMVWVKKLFGFLLLGVAFYFLAPQIERVGNKFLFLAGLTGVVGGLLLGFFDHTGGGQRVFKIFKNGIGLALLLLGLLWTQQSLQAKSTPLAWNMYSGQSMEEILSADKPVFIDFYADWCAPCKQLDRQTFSDSRVISRSEAFYLLKVDCTKPDAATSAFMSLHRVSGMPTLIFIRPDGQEIVELREIGFIDADQFLQSMAKALKAL